MATAPAAEQATAFCLRHGLEAYVQDAAQLYAASDPAASDPTSFVANYMTAVASGQHVLWRPYSFISGTHLNRKCFLLAAQRSLAAFFSERLSFGDTHSLLQLLCPDFPSSAVKNAWSSAGVDHQQSKQQQQVHTTQQQPEPAADVVQLSVFWQCLQVTFLYEHCLLLIRRDAFGADKKCAGMQQLESAIQHAAAAMPQFGWPMPPESCWKVAVSQASRASTTPDFAFKDLVRALCCCQPLVKTVRSELQATALAAADTIAAVTVSSRDASSTDDAAG